MCGAWGGGLVAGMAWVKNRNRWECWGVGIGMEMKDQIIAAYAEHLREHGAPPVSVFRFVKDRGWEERVFFGEFANFDAVESAMWRGVVDRVAAAVSSGAEWPGFTARQRLLAFLFAFSEESLAWRSLLLTRVAVCGAVARAPHLRGLEEGFKAFVGPVLEHGTAGGEIAERGRLSGAYPEVFYLHFRAVLDFHLKDTSPSYERTDAFIEKSVTLAFDLIGTQAVDSAFDFARFLLARGN